MTGKEIFEKARDKKDPICVETINLFLKFYGREVKNVALKSLSLGGIYIVGNISNDMVNFIKD
jgi:glucokinase